ncbi:MAG: YbaB/EbfC family nucleoid-associated protein [Thermacetogeniaceae bacterium]
MGFGGNMQKMMKQVQKMQADMARLQDELGNINVEGSAGGGTVQVVSNCHQEIKQVKIDKSVIDPEDAELLEDLVLTAVNDALNKSKETSAQEMEKITGGMKLPGMF